MTRVRIWALLLKPKCSQSLVWCQRRYSCTVIHDAHSTMLTQKFMSPSRPAPSRVKRCMLARPSHLSSITLSFPCPHLLLSIDLDATAGSLKMSPLFLSFYLFTHFLLLCWFIWGWSECSGVFLLDGFMFYPFFHSGLILRVPSILPARTQPLLTFEPHLVPHELLVVGNVTVLLIKFVLKTDPRVPSPRPPRPPIHATA